jgi:hypothetical protein
MLSWITPLGLHDVRLAGFLLLDLGHRCSDAQNCEGRACLGRARVLSKVGAGKRADRDNPQPFGVCGGNRRVNEPFPEVTSAERLRHFRVDQRHRIAASLVLEKCRLTIDLEFELLCVAVIDDPSVHFK